MTGKPEAVRLWQEIALALALKVLLLALIWLAWFAAPEGDALDASKMTSRLYSQQTR